MEAIIKEAYQSNFGTAYETYKELVRRIIVLGCKMQRTI